MLKTAVWFGELAFRFAVIRIDSLLPTPTVAPFASATLVSVGSGVPVQFVDPLYRVEVKPKNRLLAAIDLDVAVGEGRGRGARGIADRGHRITRDERVGQLELVA